MGWQRGSIGASTGRFRPQARGEAIQSEGSVASIRSVWKRLLAVEQVVVEGWEFDEIAGAFVVQGRPRKPDRGAVLDLLSPVWAVGGWRGPWAQGP